MSEWNVDVKEESGCGQETDSSSGGSLLWAAGEDGCPLNKGERLAHPELQAFPGVALLHSTGAVPPRPHRTRGRLPARGRASCMGSAPLHGTQLPARPPPSCTGSAPLHGIRPPACVPHPCTVRGTVLPRLPTTHGICSPPGTRVAPGQRFSEHRAESGFEDGSTASGNQCVEGHLCTQRTHRLRVLWWQFAR